MSVRHELQKQANAFPAPKELVLEDTKVDELVEEVFAIMYPTRKEVIPWTREIAAAAIRAGKLFVCGLPVRVVK